MGTLVPAFCPAPVELWGSQVEGGCCAFLLSGPVSAVLAHRTALGPFPEGKHMLSSSYLPGSPLPLVLTAEGRESPCQGVGSSLCCFPARWVSQESFRFVWVVVLHSSGCPGAQRFSSQVLGLKADATTPGFSVLFPFASLFRNGSGIHWWSVRHDNRFYIQWHKAVCQVTWLGWGSPAASQMGWAGHRQGHTALIRVERTPPPPPAPMNK